MFTAFVSICMSLITALETMEVCLIEFIVYYILVQLF
jgi:hypothetical protein